MTISTVVRATFEFVDNALIENFVNKITSQNENLELIFFITASIQNVHHVKPDMPVVFAESLRLYFYSYCP